MPVAFAVLHPWSYLRLAETFSEARAADGEPHGGLKRFFDRALAGARETAHLSGLLPNRALLDAELALQRDAFMYCFWGALEDAGLGALPFSAQLTEPLTRAHLAGELAEDDLRELLMPWLESQYVLGGLAHLDIQLMPAGLRQYEETRLEDEPVAARYAKFVVEINTTVRHAPVAGVDTH